MEVETRIEEFELLRDSSLLPKEKSYSRIGIFEVDRKPKSRSVKSTVFELKKAIYHWFQAAGGSISPRCYAKGFINPFDKQHICKFKVSVKQEVLFAMR